MNKEDLKEYREKHGLSQAELADIAKVKVGTVQSWEQGKRNISPAALQLLQNYDNVLQEEKQKPSTEKKSSEDIIAERVLQEVGPFIGQMTDRVLAALLELTMSLDRVRSEQEDIKHHQETINRLQEELKKMQDKTYDLIESKQ